MPLYRAGADPVPWSYAKRDGGLAGNGSTDDTAALQAWITSVTASGTKSGWFFFEAGTYLLGGALADTSAFNGQILLPDNSGSDDIITLTFSGPSRPTWNGDSPETGQATLKSSLTGGTGTAAVFSAGNGITNNLSVVIQNLRCEAPANPTFTFWNLSSTQDGMIDGLMIATTNVDTEPTNSNAYGIKLSTKDHGSLTDVRDVFVLGFYTGVRVAELAGGNIRVWRCKVGLELAETTHALWPIRLQALTCTTVISVTGATYADIYVDIEHGDGSPAWADTTNDLLDASNNFHGRIRWWTVEEGVGPDYSFTISGGTNGDYQRLDATAGDAFPTSPHTDMRYHRNDLGRSYYYDGTRWLSEEQFNIFTPVHNIATGTQYDPPANTLAGVIQFPVPGLSGGSDIWLTGLTTTYLIVTGGTALDGSNKWVGTFHKRPTDNSKTTVVTITIDSGASAAWRTDVQAIDALMNNGTTHYIFGVDWTKTGTPGKVWAQFNLAYRLVAT